MAKSISEQLYYESIKYTLIRERIKNTYIQIKDGKVFVKAPRSASINYIEKLLEEKTITTDLPVSFLALHPDVTIIVDQAAYPE